jgi:hypothetical protein
MIKRMGRPARQDRSHGQRRSARLAGDSVRAEADADLVELDYALARACERARRVYETVEPWPDRVRASLAALLDLFDEEPRLARVCVMYSTTPGSAAAARRKDVLAVLAGVIDEGRDSCYGRVPPPFTAEGVLAGALGAIHGRLVQPDSEPLIELLDPLMSFIVLPYMGAFAARGELAGSTVVRSREPSEVASPMGHAVRD